tara:strand:- start:181 stop:453 length:273 start_codon:yes stop_codon:yes gene_type:complete
MQNKIINIFFLVIFLTFILLVTKYYFSEKNIISTNKSRSSYATLLDADINDLPLLKNDTNNIIVYINDLEEFKNKRKKRSWEDLISNNNE